MGCAGSKEANTDPGAKRPEPESEKPRGPSMDESAGTSGETKSSEAPAKDKEAPPSGTCLLGGDPNRRLEDEYVKGGEIGRGGFAIVYAGKQKATGREVAIKVVQKNSVDTSDLQSLKREIDIMRQVDHVNVLPLIDIFETEKEVTIITEFESGGELFYKIVDRGSYSEADAAGIVKQLVTGVEYLHSKGIAHRDLKPENILCSGDDDETMVIKISDFGLSKIFSAGEVLKTACGTPDYAAPEVLSSTGSYSNAVDMWSVGVITYVLLCGYPPFYAKDQRELFTQILNADYEFPEEDWDAISEEAHDFIRKLLVIDPNQRMTATEALHHPWLENVDARHDTSVEIKEKLQSYNKHRKEQAS